MAEDVLSGRSVHVPAAAQAETVAVRRRHSGDEAETGPDLAPDLVARILAQPGRALDLESRARLEAGFGTDLSGLRVHDGPLASRSAADLGARAWSAGRHIAFANGTFRPGTPAGDYLIAHEVAHVIQGGQMLRRQSLVESLADGASKWYDKTKWAAYRGMIHGLKAAKNAAIVPCRQLVAHLNGATASVASALLDINDFMLDMAIALLLAIVGLAVGFAEGIVGLVTGLLRLAYGLLKITVDYLKSLVGHPDDYRKDCAAIVAALTNLVPAIRQAFGDWLERYKHATLEEQVIMGAEIVGQVVAFIATFGAGGARAGKALTITVGTGSVLGPEMAMARVVTIPAVATKTAAEAAIVTSQMMAMQGSGGGSGPAPSANDPTPKQGTEVRRPGAAGPGPLVGATDQEIASAVDKMEGAGEWLQLGEHGGAKANREAVGVAGTDAKQATLAKPASGAPMAGPAAHQAALQSSTEGVQSAHGFQQSLGRSLPGYDPDHALTRLMQRSEHTAMDQFWKDSFKAMRDAGRTKITAQEAFGITAELICRSASLSNGEKTSLILRLRDEMFLELELRREQILELPYANIKPAMKP